ADLVPVVARLEGRGDHPVPADDVARTGAHLRADPAALDLTERGATVAAALSVAGAAPPGAGARILFHAGATAEREPKNEPKTGRQYTSATGQLHARTIALVNSRRAHN